MQIRVANNLAVTDPTLELMNWCKDNLVLDNPEYDKKKRMGFWTGNTPQRLTLYETRGQKLILPYGTITYIPEEITREGVFINNFKPLERLPYKADVPLYDFQQKAVNAMLEAQCGILQSPAGSGKTQMGIALATKLRVRTLWLCHTKDLVRQSKQRAEQYINKNLLGTITEGKVNIGEWITFATVQTMEKLDLSQYKDYWDCIITDEVHRVSGSPTSMTRYSKVLNSLSARHKYGLSATVHRADGLIESTYALVGKIAYKVPDEAVSEITMPVGIQAVPTGIRMGRQALNTDGTLNYAKLIEYLTQSQLRNEEIAEWLEYKKQYSSLILSDRLEHLETLISYLPHDMREQAVMIHGKTEKKKREQALEDMRKSRKKYLFATYALAKEGLDIPCLERLYLTTPQKDYAIITQSIGRIARRCDGKADPIVYDFVDEIGYLIKSYKKRCTTYRKNNCYFVGGENNETA